jgi:hypothetical protein
MVGAPHRWIRMSGRGSIVSLSLSFPTWWGGSTRPKLKGHQVNSLNENISSQPIVPCEVNHGLPTLPDMLMYSPRLLCSKKRKSMNNYLVDLPVMNEGRAPRFA